jgi:SOS-response transcriptional repressor LexA
MTGLTVRQAQLLEIIRTCIAEHGIAPTMREMRARLGIASNGIAAHIDALEKKGFVRRGPGGTARTLTVVGDAPSPGDLVWKSVEEGMLLFALETAMQEKGFRRVPFGKIVRRFETGAARCSD